MMMGLIRVFAVTAFVAAISSHPAGFTIRCDGATLDMDDDDSFIDDDDDVVDDDDIMDDDSFDDDTESDDDTGDDDVTDDDSTDDDTGDDDTTVYPDADGDGYTADVDCNDNASIIHPDAGEAADDGIDNDCDGFIDLDDPDAEVLVTIDCVIGGGVEATLNGVLSSTWIDQVDYNGDGFDLDDYPIDDSYDLLEIVSSEDGCWNDSSHCYNQPFAGDGVDYVFSFSEREFAVRVRNEYHDYAYLDLRVVDATGDCTVIVNSYGERYMIDATP